MHQEFALCSTTWNDDGLTLQDFLWSIDGSGLVDPSGSEDTTDIFITYALTALVNLSDVRKLIIPPPYTSQ